METFEYEPEMISDKGGSDPSSLDIYLRDINKVPLLTGDEERDLARRTREGDPKAKDHLVRANLRFVVSIAKRYANQGIPIEDLINEGNIGLIKAAERFDVDRGFKFISYAVWWIRQAMLQSLSQSSRIVRLPLNRAGVLYRIGKATRELDQELERVPTVEEIAARIGVPVDEVLSTMRIPNTHVSLDDTLSDDAEDHSYMEYLEDENAVQPDAYAYVSALSEDLDKALATLTDRERTIMTLYYGLGSADPMTLEDIGKRIGLTRERIRQIKEQAIERLRHHSRSKYLEAYIEN
jgi:RNA polymerase primary sigma factor